MRVLMTTDSIGGVWTFTQELTLGLLELGCATALVSVGGFRTREQAVWCTRMKTLWGEQFGSQVTDGPLEWMQENDEAYGSSAATLVRVAEAFRPDVLQSNQFCFGSLSLDVPKVVTAHSDVLSWAACCRERPLEDSTWMRKYKSLVCTGLAGADAVVTPTHSMLRALRSNFNLPAQVFVIPNGRKVEVTARRPRRLQSVTAGRFWDEAKGVAMLSSVRSPILLLLAGESSDEQTDAFIKNAQVQSVGPLSQEALLALFSESALYVCTSRYEPFGLAPLEAALCGCAVLANDISSLREVWGDGALYFRDADGLSLLLDELFHNNEVLSSLQDRSFHRAQRYTREAMALSYLELFERLSAPQGAFSHVA